MWDVFICYAREDRKTARRLYADLQQAGLKPWMDTEDLLPGQKWRVIINHVLKKSSYVMVLLSPNSISKRGFVQKELKKALDVVDELPPSDIFVIPVRLDVCDPVDDRLQELHWVDLFPDYEKGLKRILRVLLPEEQEKPGGQQRKTPVPPEQPDHRPPIDVWKRDTQQLRKEREADYDLLSEKIARLRKSRILETDAAVLFKLDKQIEDAEQKREDLVRNIKALLHPPQPESSQIKFSQPEPSDNEAANAVE